MRQALAPLFLVLFSATAYGQTPVLIGGRDAGGVVRPAMDATPVPVKIPAAFPVPATVEGVVAEGVAASTADPVVGGIEARALGALPAVLAGQAARLRGTLVGSLYVTLTDAAGTVTALVADGGTATGLVQAGVWTGAASVRTLGLASGAQFAATLDGTGNALTSAAAGALRPLHTLLLDAAGTVLGSAANPVRTDPTGTTRQPTSPIAGQAGIAANSGAADALTTRVVSATDSPDVTSLATIAGDTTSIDGHIPQLTIGASAPAASLSVVQDTTGAWTVTADTELPAAAAPDDAISNPTTPGVTAFGTFWDTGASKWVRLRGTAAGGILTQVSSLPSLDGTDVDLELAGTAVLGGQGDTGAGALRVDTAGHGIPVAGTPDACFDVVAGEAGNAHVMPAYAGRYAYYIQIQDDDSGQIRFAHATTTGATCTGNGAGNVGTLLDAGGASTAGGYVERQHYSGPVAVCAVAGTINVCWGDY
jgi:hypothetical protein